MKDDIFVFSIYFLEVFNMKIEFVSYSGKYPCLCYGQLTLKIDNKLTTFGYDSDFPRFWSSGGRAYFDNDNNACIEKGNWDFVTFYGIPDIFIEHKEEMIRIFNENVKHGCCGGCL
jgi:hypothetical protein